MPLDLFFIEGGSTSGKNVKIVVYSEGNVSAFGSTSTNALCVSRRGCRVLQAAWSILTTFV